MAPVGRALGPIVRSAPVSAQQGSGGIAASEMDWMCSPVWEARTMAVAMELIVGVLLPMAR